ncbi:MAG: hypothetical protein ACD_79C00393G0004 [uncultured bacterium]|nr:MAG: hypothetical protein ACD_79C00393G0004 [uncultured bacterium]
MNKTPLFDEHVKLNAKIIDFAGYEMPVYYDSIISEHEAVRKDCGVFDVSHMAEFCISGEDAFSFLQYIVTNDISKLTDGKILYSPICNEKGGIVDDVLVYRKSASQYMMVVNASNNEKVFSWLQDYAVKNFPTVKLNNITQKIALIALQGPKAQNVLTDMHYEVKGIRYYHFKHFKKGDDEIIISRTGYTGEDGFEIFMPDNLAVNFWRDILEAGKKYNIKPVGLGARDTLRLEVCFSLYGHELSDTTTPFEAGIGWTVAMKKEDFVGKQHLIDYPALRTLVGFEMIDKSIPRQGYAVFCDNKKAGFVTSGTYLPTVKKNMGLAIINKEYANKGGEISIEIRSKLFKAKIVDIPFLLPFNRRKKHV